MFTMFFLFTTLNFGTQLRLYLIESIVQLTEASNSSVDPMRFFFGTRKSETQSLIENCTNREKKYFASFNYKFRHNIRRE